MFLGLELGGTALGEFLDFAHPAHTAPHCHATENIKLANIIIVSVCDNAGSGIVGNPCGRLSRLMSISVFFSLDLKPKSEKSCVILICLNVV